MKPTLRFVVTAGPTREHLDPVRFLSNPSTGRMGFAVAAEAARRGFETVLVAGPVSLPTPKGVTRIDVVSAREMFAAVKASCGVAGTVLVAVAAVADWRPAVCAKTKLKKGVMKPVLKLVRNPDILKSVKGVRKIGFAAETDRVLDEAARKCRAKGLEFIVANDVTEKGSGFGTATNRVTFVFPDGSKRPFACASKRVVARRIVDQILCRDSSLSTGLTGFTGLWKET